MKTAQHADIFTAIAHPVRRQLLDHSSCDLPASEDSSGCVFICSALNRCKNWILESYRRLWNLRLDRLDDYLKEHQAKEKTHDDEK